MKRITKIGVWNANLAGKWKITAGRILYEELWPEYPRNE